MERLNQCAVKRSRCLSSPEEASLKRWLDRCALVGMVAGVGLMLQPFWGEGLRYGFFVAALFTILHIITSHWQLEER